MADEDAFLCPLHGHAYAYAYVARPGRQHGHHFAVQIWSRLQSLQHESFPLLKHTVLGELRTPPAAMHMSGEKSGRRSTLAWPPSTAGFA